MRRAREFAVGALRAVACIVLAGVALAPAGRAAPRAASGATGDLAARASSDALAADAASHGIGGVGDELAVVPTAVSTAAPTVRPGPAPRPAADFEIPRNDGWVTDLAHLLTSTEERELEAAMEAYKRGSGHDLALLTVPDLQGRSIEEFALEVARAWKLGSVATSDGALLVVAKSERKLRIEVGRGLEGTLTDARCAQIIRNEITPEFKAGRYGAGIHRGIAAMQAAAGGAPVNVPRSIPASAPESHEGLGALLCPILFLIVFLLVLTRLRRLGGGRWTSGRRSWGGATWGWSVGGRGSGGGFGGGGFSGFGGGGGFSGGGSSGGW